MANALDHREIIGAAGYVTGQFDILDDGFAQRFRKVTDWLNMHGNLSASQVTVARKQLLQIVITRVLLAADRKRIPAIATEKIERPIFVIVRQSKPSSRTRSSKVHASSICASRICQRIRSRRFRASMPARVSRIRTSSSKKCARGWRIPRIIPIATDAMPTTSFHLD